MPFITPEKRKKMDKIKTDEAIEIINNEVSELNDIQVGDKCYMFYKYMVKRWKEKSNWTTAHNIYQDMINHIDIDGYAEDTNCAYELAWQVFFQLYVMPYELEKKKLNGDI